MRYNSIANHNLTLHCSLLTVYTKWRRKHPPAPLYLALDPLLFLLDTTFKLLFCFCQMSSLEAGSEAVVAGKLRNNLWGSFSPRIAASVQVNKNLWDKNMLIVY
jgi:hypothetical protein